MVRSQGRSSLLSWSCRWSSRRLAREERRREEGDELRGRNAQLPPNSLQLAFSCSPLSHVVARKWFTSPHAEAEQMRANESCASFDVILASVDALFPRSAADSHMDGMFSRCPSNCFLLCVSSYSSDLAVSAVQNHSMTSINTA